MKLFRGIKGTLVLTLVVNAALALFKLLLGLWTSSLGVMSDAVENSVDTLTCIIGLVAVTHAEQPPDADHPYGHAKFETLAAFTIGGFLFVTCFELAKSAMGRLLGHANGQPHPNLLAMGLLAVTLLVKLALSLFERSRSGKLNSEILRADAIHTGSDVLVTLSVLIGMGLTLRGFPWADAVATLVVAALIAISGYRIVASTIPVLVDRVAVSSDLVHHIVMRVPGVMDCHEIKSRGKLGQLFITMHLNLSPHLDVETSHVVTEQVEQRLLESLGPCELNIHVEPVGHS